MKALLFSIGLLTSFFCSAQENSSSEYKPFRFGFNLGLQQSFVMAPNGFGDEYSIDNALGYRLGILGRYQTPKNLFILVRSELAVNNSSIMYSNTENESQRYHIMPTTVQSGLHLGYSFEKLSLKPFFYSGCDFKLGFEQNLTEDALPPKNDLAIEIGVGIKKQFEYFDLMPEIRYSHGLWNINHYANGQLFVHELSFSLIFM